MEIPGKRTAGGHKPGIGKEAKGEKMGEAKILEPDFWKGRGRYSARRCSRASEERYEEKSKEKMKGEREHG